MKNAAEIGHGEIHFSHLFKTGDKKVNGTTAVYREVKKYNNK